MKIIEGLEHRFSIDSIKKEIALWSEEDGLNEEFKIQFADFNSGIAIAVIPIVIVLCFVTLIITEAFNRFGVYSTGNFTIYCYATLMLICAIAYFLIYRAAKTEPFNEKKVNGAIYAVSTSVLIWLFVFVHGTSSVVGASIIYTATISTVTQTMILPPVFSGFYIFGGLTGYTLINILKKTEGSFETDAILGMAILSVIWFMVAYMRYYSRCRLIYNEKIISAQNERLDDIVKQLIEETEQLEDAKAKLEKAYVTDRLTGAYNRWYWDKFINSISKECIECQKDVSVMMIDLDNFKNVNDTYGHGMGDECLISVSQVIKDGISEFENTEFFRLGGEEFAIVSSSFGKTELLSSANKILKDITNIKIDGLNTMLTASIGIYKGKISSAADVEKHLSKADAQMYNAKANGKNRVSFSFE